LVSADTNKRLLLILWGGNPYIPRIDVDRISVHIIDKDGAIVRSIVPNVCFEIVGIELDVDDFFLGNRDLYHLVAVKGEGHCFIRVIDELDRGYFPGCNEGYRCIGGIL